MDRVIFTDKTLKLKTKMILFSATSLFLGLTEKIPHDFKLIGLNLSENNSILGWFILATTVVLSIHYIMTALLDMEIYNKENIIINKTKDTQSEFSGMTADELNEQSIIPSEYDKEHRSRGWGNPDSESIYDQNIKIEQDFGKNYIKIKTRVTFIFEFLLPVLLAGIGISFLFSFLLSK
jgi:hypothetical protein